MVLRHSTQAADVASPEADHRPAAGASGGVAAASALLTEVLPAALGMPLDQFLAALDSSGDAAVEADAAELR